VDLTIESLRDGDQAQLHALMRQAFGGTDPFDPDAPNSDPDRVVAAYDADRLAGTVMAFGFAQTWGGRAVPCAGVSAVAVAPEVRGRGAARRMLAETFVRAGRRGEVVASLYPTTSSLYRSVGFEVVTTFQRRSIPLAGLPRPGAGGDLRWRRVRPDDPVKPALHDRMAAGLDGWFRGDPTWWAFRGRREAADERTNRFCYVASRDGTDVVVAQWRYDGAQEAMYDLELEVLAALDGDALHGALSLVAGHGTTAGAVRTTLPLALLRPSVPELQRTRVLEDWPLMLRLVDAAGAVQARGYPRGVTGRVELDVVDEALPANAGPHVLEVDGGAASLVPGGAGTVRVRAQDLAVVYAGGDVRALRLAGRLPGAGDADLDLLAAAFTSRPTVPLFF